MENTNNSNPYIEEKQAPSWYRIITGKETVKVFKSMYFRMPECSNLEIVILDDEPEVTSTDDGVPIIQLNVETPDGTKVWRTRRGDILYKLAQIQLKWGSLKGLRVSVVSPCEREGNHFYDLIVLDRLKL